MFDHSSYVLKNPLGSMLIRVDDTRSWIGCERKQSLRGPKHPASAVQTSRRIGEEVPPEADAPRACSGLAIAARCLLSEGSAMGVDLGLPFDNEEEVAVAVRSFASSVLSAPVPPPVTKNVSSRMTFADREASICWERVSVEKGTVSARVTGRVMVLE